MDMDAVTRMLRDAYWWIACDNAPDLIRRAAENSGLVLGAFLQNGEQAGYARVVTDFVRTAYIADVIVRADCRHQGVGSAMMRYLQRSDTLSAIGKFFLITKDAHALYEANGFHVTTRGRDYMEWTRETI